MIVRQPEIKCVVWDLDNTLWDGTLLESDELLLKPWVVDTVMTIDERGILQSICSKNDFEPAFEQLRRFGLADYFLYPQISWGPKSRGIERVRERLNLGIDTFAFVDDQPFERDEVSSVFPKVMCVDAQDSAGLLNHRRMQPRFVTAESKERRLLYKSQILREEEEESFDGPSKEFLHSLDLQFRIHRATPADIPRVEELTVRTNQLNTTGTVYSAEQLMRLCESTDHLVLVCELTDRYGSYGKVGVALIEKLADAWLIRLFVMSCRVVSRGVGAVFLSYIARECAEAGSRLLASFRHTDRNRMMFVAYRFGNFREVATDETGLMTLENDLSKIADVPDHISLVVG